MKENYAALLVPIALIIAGTLSPSNGVDEGYIRNSGELLFTAFGVMLAAIVVYLVVISVNAPMPSKKPVGTLKK